MSIVIAGATGQVGGRIAELLLEAGQRPTLLVRQPGKAAAWRQRGAELKTASLEDADAVTRATENAEALFWLTPPNFSTPDLSAYADSLALAATQAIRTHGIRHVVLLSGMGAGSGRTDWGIVNTMGRVEQRLNETGAHVRHLRAGWFMDNFLWQIEPLRKDGAFYLPYDEDFAFPLIATSDIAAVAARLLVDPLWDGQRGLSLMGPRHQSLGEVAQDLTALTGRPIRLVQIPMEAYMEQFARMGASPDALAQYAAMFTNMAVPDGIYSEARTPESFTPTTFREFAAQKLVPALGPVPTV